MHKTDLKLYYKDLKHARNSEINIPIFSKMDPSLPDAGPEKNSSEKIGAFLVMCPPWDTRMPPVGLGFLAASLDKNNIRYRVFDLNIMCFSAGNEKEKKLWDMKNYPEWRSKDIHAEVFRKNKSIVEGLFSAVENDSPAAVCFSVNAGNCNSSLFLMKELKKSFPGIKIGVGGPNIDEDYFGRSEMKDYADFAVLGEAELLLPVSIMRIRGKIPLAGIAGILLPPDFRIASGNGRTIIQDLDSLDYPTYAGFPLDKYTARTLPILGSRGCINKCSFCSDWKISRAYRSRSAENILDEILAHGENTGITDFNFVDLVINGNIRNLERLCSFIISSNKKITWSGQGIIRKEMTPQLLAKMKESGFRTITYGVESFSDSVLSAMRKNTSRVLINKVIKNTKKSGINVQVNLIVGFPGETEKDFLGTLSSVRQLSKSISKVTSLLPLAIFGKSDIELNLAAYRILPGEKASGDSSAEDLVLGWKDNSGLNLNIRMDRISRLQALLDELQIEYEPYVDCRVASENMKDRDDKKDIAGPIRKDSGSAISHDNGKPANVMPGFCCIGITDYCFFRCRMCDKWKEDISIKPGSRHPDLNQWKKFIFELSTVVKDQITGNMEDRFEINFAGGEALTHPLTLELVSYANSLGFKTSIPTNGFIINEKMAGMIAKSGLQVLSLSLDSLDETIHDRYRGRKGAYKGVMNAIKCMSKYRYPDLGIISIIHEGTYTGIPKLQEWVMSHPKLNATKLMAIMQPNNTGFEQGWYEKEEFEDLWPKDTKKVVEMLDRVLLMKKLSAKNKENNLTKYDKIENTTQQIIAFKDYFRNPDRFVKNSQPCNFDTSVQVSAVGEIYMCYHFDKLGNVMHDDFTSIWNSAAADKIRQQIYSCRNNCHELLNCYFKADYPFDVIKKN